MPGKRPSAKAILLTVAVLILGAAIGGLGTYLAGHMNERRHHPRIMDRLSQQLQLTPDQQKQIRAVLSEGHKRWDSVYRQSQEQARPQYDAVRNETRARIRALLTPTQQPQFDDFLKKLDAERKARQHR
jgi:Spy/CpxP family protein refolding chaperone